MRSNTSINTCRHDSQMYKHTHVPLIPQTHTCTTHSPNTHMYHSFPKPHKENKTNGRRQMKFVYWPRKGTKVCQWLATGRWFSQGTPVSSTNKTDRHDISEILLKVALNTINNKPSKRNTCNGGVNNGNDPVSS